MHKGRYIPLAPLFGLSLIPSQLTKEAHSLKNPVPIEKSRAVKVDLKLRGNKLIVICLKGEGVFTEMWSDALEIAVES